jgi:hypothetical protein
MKRLALLSIFLFATLTLAGCTKQVTAPVPGTINTMDAYAARIIGDAGAAIRSVKLWEVCSDSAFPATVTFDSVTSPCDSTAGLFPASFRAPLFKVEKSYNIALVAGRAYHAGAGKDTTALTAALAQLSADITAMFAVVKSPIGQLEMRQPFEGRVSLRH